jgi:hypothetical protein
LVLFFAEDVTVVSPGDKANAYGSLDGGSINNEIPP